MPNYLRQAGPLETREIARIIYETVFCPGEEIDGVIMPDFDLAESEQLGGHERAMQAARLVPNYIRDTEKRQAGIDLTGEIEITPQMVEAGFAVLCRSPIADGYLPADRSLVEDIFRAMRALADELPIGAGG